MRNLEILFSDLFGDSRITNPRLETYTLDHVARIVANNPGGVFGTLITDTNSALEAFGQAYNLKGGNVGDRKASTVAKNTARKNFTNFIRQQEGTIRGKFGENSTPYIQFFPNGLSPFNDATDIGYMGLLNNIKARATQYVADLGAPFETQVDTLAAAYMGAEANQTTEKGDVSNARDVLTTERTDLTRQLTINALTIALHFPLDTDKRSVYFDTSLLFAQKRTRIHKGEPAAGVTVKVTKITYEAGKFVKMQNKGATGLTFQMYLLGNPVGNSFSIAAGNELEKKMSDFFSNADELKVTNTGTVTGKYVVKLIA